MLFIKKFLYSVCINSAYFIITVYSYLQLKYNNLFRQNSIQTYTPIWNTEDQTSLELEYQYKNRLYKITGTNYKKMKHYVEYTLMNLDNNQIPYYKWISAEVVNSVEHIDADKLLSIIKMYSGPYGDFYVHSPELIQLPPLPLNNTTIVLIDHKLNNYTIDYNLQTDNYYAQLLRAII